MIGLISTAVLMILVVTLNEKHPNTKVANIVMAFSASVLVDAILQQLKTFVWG